VAGRNLNGSAPNSLGLALHCLHQDDLNPSGVPRVSARRRQLSGREEQAIIAAPNSPRPRGALPVLRGS
jgi:hypothetical protein